MKNLFYGLNQGSKSFVASFCFFFLTIINVSSQEGIGINTTTPHVSSALDITSSDKGILIPRLTLGQRNNIPSPTSGLMIYQTDNTPGFYYFNNLGNWVRISDSNSGFSLPYSGVTSYGPLAFKVQHNNAPINGVAITGESINTQYGTGVHGITNNPSGYGVLATNLSQGTGMFAESNTTFETSAAIKAYNTNGGNSIFALNSGSNLNYATIKTINTGGGFALKASTENNSNSQGGTILAENNGTAGFAVRGVSNASNTAGIRGESTNGVAISGYTPGSIAISGSTVSGTALKGNSLTGYALEAIGDVRLTTDISPTAGAVLTSVDALGNAVWKEDRVAFKAYGMNGAYNNFPPLSSTKVHFGGEKYDLGLDYHLLPGSGTPNTFSSTFVVPVNGIYHFDIGFTIYVDYDEAAEYSEARLMLERNGVVSVLAESKGSMYQLNLENLSKIAFSTDELLNANDKIYVVLYHNSDVVATISYGTETWFNGHLVKAL